MIRLLRFLRRLVRRPWCDPWWQPYWALEGEDVIASLLLRAGVAPKGRFYVDIGAHLPRRYSTTYLLYRLGWRGLLVEPNPDLARALRQERRGDIVEECGVSDTTGVMKFHVFAVPCYSTFSAQHAAKLEANEGMKPLRVVTTPVKTLGDLAAAHGSIFYRAELLKVDAEGHDLNVLQSNDWSRFQPRFVMVEMLDATAATAPDHELGQFLRQRGYALRSFLYHSAVFERQAVSLGPT